MGLNKVPLGCRSLDITNHSGYPKDDAFSLILCVCVIGHRVVRKISMEIQLPQSLIASEEVDAFWLEV